MEDFGGFIRRERKRQKMTQAELGDRSCIHRETVGTIERNMANVRLDYLESLLDVLGYELKAVKKQ